MGLVLRVLGTHQGDEELLEASVAAYRSALEVYEGVRHDAYAQVARGNLERVQQLLRKRPT